MIVTRYFETPLGKMMITGEDEVVTGMHFIDQMHAPAAPAPSDDGAFEKAVHQICEWFAGGRREFDFDFRPSGSEFQHGVWEALKQIPYGRTVTYAAIAEAIGRPGAARACGLAIGRNPLSIVVPCHRVIGSNGKLTGYAGGVDRKKWLLEHEGYLPAL